MHCASFDSKNIDTLPRPLPLSLHATMEGNLFFALLLHYYNFQTVIQSLMMNCFT